MDGWVAPDRAKVYTGKEYTQEELDVASWFLVPYAGVTPDQPEDSILPRDRTWLGMAAAYQAVWMRGKPGLLEHRESHKSTSADGTSVQRTSDSDIMLAPLAARCLRNLSWVGPRSVATVTAERRVPGFLNEAGDEFHPWTSRPIA